MRRERKIEKGNIEEWKVERKEKIKQNSCIIYRKLEGSVLALINSGKPDAKTNIEKTDYDKR